MHRKNFSRKRLFYTALLFLSPICMADAQDLWEKTMPIQGRLAASAIAVNSKGDIFAGSFDGGLYCSKNEGGSWNKISLSLSEMGPIQSILMNSRDHIFVVTSSGDVLRSVDDGQSWARVYSPDLRQKPYTTPVAINAIDQIIVGGNDAMAYSVDDGANWERIHVNKPVGIENLSALMSIPGGQIIAGTSDGSILVSADAGKSWRQIPLTTFPIRSVTMTSQGDIFCGTLGAGVYKSHDFGKTWVHSNNGLFDRNILSLAISARGEILAGASTGAIFRSADYGETWSRIHVISSAYGVWALAGKANGSIFAATDAGVFRSMNGGNDWESTGLVNAEVRTVASNANGYVFAGTFGAGVWRSTDNGLNWTRVNSGLRPINIVSLAVDGNGHVFAGTLFGGIYRTTDNGNTWTKTSFSDQTISAMAVDGDGTIYAGTQDFLGANTLAGVFYSTDRGENWQASAFSNDLNSLAVDDGGFVYAGWIGGVARTTHPDPDSAWVPYWWRDRNAWFRPRPDVVPGDAMSIAIKESDQIFAATFEGGVYQFSDTTWTQVNTGLTDTVALSVTVALDGDLFVGTFDGSIFQSNDNGSNWILSNPGMTNRAVPQILTSPSGYLFAATNGDGVFRNLTTVPAAPILTMPADGATVGTEEALLTWVAVTGIAYQLQVSLDSNFQTTLVDIANITDGSFLLGNLLNETTYYWRVRAANRIGGSDWSPAYSFWTNIPPLVPLLLFPEHESTDLESTVTFRWKQAERANSYELQYSTGSSFQARVSIFGLVDTSFNAAGLAVNTTYYWRVNATNAAGTSDWSEVWSFTTGGITSVEQADAGVPKTYYLSANFPNPFNPSTTIEFGVPERTHVTLRIFDVTGRTVASLVDEPLPPARYRVLFEAGELSSGVYFYRLEARGAASGGSFVTTRKLTLLK